MSVDRSFIFNLDLAGPVDPPPILFYAIRAPCSCGRPLTDNVYSFFPSAVFVHGTCPECGPQQAIFAPDMKDAPRESLAREIERVMARLAADLGHTHGANPAAVLDGFLNYLASVACAPADGTNPAT